MKQTAKHLLAPLALFILFWGIGIGLWQGESSIFYVINFGYLGTALCVGIGCYIVLPRNKKSLGRRVAQLLIGIYMLGFLGVLMHENMQLEGFFFYVLGGIFEGSVIHYGVAKIFGPLLFGRGFCGWACWTSMVLDLLPYTQTKHGRLSAKWESLRSVHFGVSVGVVLLSWYLLNHRPVITGTGELLWLAGGNALYFAAALTLAFALKDNRAFCKYLCPITVLLKIPSRVSLFKIEGDKEKCTGCGACTAVCPMDIDVMGYVRNDERVLSTECIFCLTCTTVCPEGILDGTSGIDIGGKELIEREPQ